jgi:hypothetical protein
VARRHRSRAPPAKPSPSARTRNSSEKWRRPDLFRLGDYATGDALRSAAAGAASDGVNDNRGSAIAENGIRVGAESHGTEFFED